ncbi:MAG: hypothetical protein LBR12_02465, partial [Opitutaceae bacterium]|nr:hypothetical protein [Opitutaceae bacterium]
MLDFVRNLVREWMGDPSLTTAELDRQILDWLGWKKRERSDSSATAAKPAQSAAPQTAAQQASTRQPAAATGNVFIVRPAASTAAPQSTATEPATEKPPAL